VGWQYLKMMIGKTMIPNEKAFIRKTNSRVILIAVNTFLEIFYAEATLSTSQIEFRKKVRPDSFRIFKAQITSKDWRVHLRHTPWVL
jgi:hypothetical protein